MSKGGEVDQKYPYILDRGDWWTGFRRGNPTGSHRPYFVTKPVALWLQKTLKLYSLDAMHETHISEWASANNVYMDKAYSTEAREGGTIALGHSIPALPREKLNVFSDAEWEERKDSLVLETWWKDAQAAVKP